MRLNFVRNPMPLLPAMLLQAQAGEGAEVAAQDVPHHVPAPDQHSVPALDHSLAYLPTPSRPQSPDPVAPVLKHDHSSAQPETTAGSFSTTKDAPLGGDFHPSPPSDSDPEDSTTQDMVLDALRALANAAVAVDSDIPPGNTSQVPAASPCAPTASVTPGNF
uniref:Uncharacterized protein n=1 Tax=Tanacetum cinerariifolium TaxID=118510 RepID=A0A699L3F4_TANCI|nr:hypothetical protein [Tanacetum cinerariifolium]